MEVETQLACSFAAENGFLVEADVSFGEWRGQEAGLVIGAEHMVEFFEEEALVGKITVPPAFGLVPVVRRWPIVNLHSDTTGNFREAIEFDQATPLEYLDRWSANNQIFSDDVKLRSVIRWRDGAVSFSITQPQYPKQAASHWEIERYFEQSGWTRIANEGHTIFFNYAHQTLAIDALPRNCYMSEHGLQPFDVILCHPSAELETFLRLYPG